MNINRKSVPASLVEIVNITNKDGTPIAPDNWRNKWIGKITMLTLAGGINRLTPFFRMHIEMEDGKITCFDPDWEGNASTGPGYPVEVAPNIYAFETHTSIYHFRILDEEEDALVNDALLEIIEQRMQEIILRMAGNPDQPDNGTLLS